MSIKHPKGKRRLYILKLGKRNVYCRLKSGTGDLFGLKVIKDIKQTKSAVTRGAKGTKSYIVYLKKATKVGGQNVVSVSVPVDGKTKLKEFYAWAQSFSFTAGMRTPWGISYYWADTPSTGKSGSGLLGQAASAASSALSTIGADASAVGGAISTLGSYLAPEAAAIGGAISTLGGYLSK